MGQLIMKRIFNSFKTKWLRNAYISTLVVIFMLTTMTSVTYSWFLSNKITVENVFTAGTVNVAVIDEYVVATESVNPGSNFAFVPNSAEASVSKVDLDLVNPEEVARYSTIPNRSDIVLGALPNYRAARMAMDSGGNAWVLNTMTGSNYVYATAQGSVARISADPVESEILGDTTSNAGGSAGIIENDVRVEYFNLGLPGEGPRTINIIEENGDVFIWIGFHMGKYYQKYKFDPDALVDEKLVPVGDKVLIGDFTPYYAVIDSAKRLWVTSRNANPFPNQGVSGVFYFDTQNPGGGIIEGEYDLPGTIENNPYAIIADDGKIWVSDGGNWDALRERFFAVYDPHVIDPNTGKLIPTYISSGVSKAMRGFIRYGEYIWASTIDGQVRRGSYNDAVTENNGWTFENVITTNLGELSGIGYDNYGYLWVIRLVANQLYRFNPNGFGDIVTIDVGSGPYAYDNFTKPGSICKTVEWTVENAGSKKIYVRVKPDAIYSGGVPIDITLCDSTANWHKRSDGWWYYGTALEPDILFPADGIEQPKIESVCFKFCFGTNSSNVEVKLIAQAVQTTNNAIIHEWLGSHAW
jgi:hypothetical protein